MDIHIYWAGRNWWCHCLGLFLICHACVSDLLRHLAKVENIGFSLITTLQYWFNGVDTSRHRLKVLTCCVGLRGWTGRTRRRKGDQQQRKNRRNTWNIVEPHFLGSPSLSSLINRNHSIGYSRLYHDQNPIC